MTEQEKKKQNTSSKIKRLHIVAKHFVQTLLSGNYRSTFRGSGVEFDEVRKYVEGDDVRMIDWNVSSRLGAAYTKIFKEERELTLFVVVDVSPSLYFGTHRQAIEQASELLFLFSLAAEHNSDKVGALFFSDRIEKWYKPRKKCRHILNPDSDHFSFKKHVRISDLAHALQVVNQSLKQRGFCVIISDFHMRGYEKDICFLARRHEVLAIRLYDESEKNLPKLGFMSWQDPETKDTLPAYTSTRYFRIKYYQYWKEQRMQWVRLCKRCGISSLEISSIEDASESLVRYFRYRKGK